MSNQNICSQPQPRLFQFVNRAARSGKRNREFRVADAGVVTGITQTALQWWPVAMDSLTDRMSVADQSEKASGPRPLWLLSQEQFLPVYKRKVNFPLF